MGQSTENVRTALENTAGFRDFQAGHTLAVISNGHHQRMSVSAAASLRFEPSIRHVSEFRRTIGEDIADLRCVRRSGSDLSLPTLKPTLRHPLGQPDKGYVALSSDVSSFRGIYSTSFWCHHGLNRSAYRQYMLILVLRPGHHQSNGCLSGFMAGNG